VVCTWLGTPIHVCIGMVCAGAPHCPSGPSEFACADYVCV